jgi:cob(I)alamin adenosyltransferase
MVHTGYGKGKTTAALGLAFRALGHDLPVCVIQFIKGNWKYGELKTAERFKGLLDFHVVGKGFTWNSKDPEKDRATARDGWNLAKSLIAEGRHYLIILAEFYVGRQVGMGTRERRWKCLRARPEGLHVW